MEHQDQHIANILKSLQAIEPSGDFAARSRAIVLATNQPVSGFKQWTSGFVEHLKLGVFLTAMGLLFLVIIGGFSMQVRDNLNDRKILSEAKKIQFQIHIDEVEYFAQSAKEVSVALEKISDTSH